MAVATLHPKTQAAAPLVRVRESGNNARGSFYTQLSPTSRPHWLAPDTGFTPVGWSRCPSRSVLMPVAEGAANLVRALPYSRLPLSRDHGDWLRGDGLEVESCGVRRGGAVHYGKT